MERFGDVMKEWRGLRRMSQLDLGLAADVSARHISFLETGRSRPSKEMVVRLCDELQVPNADRNRVLLSAGMAPTYEAKSASDEELVPLKKAVDWMLSSHAPYPAMAIDRHWQLVDLNEPAQMMLRAVDVQVGDSLIDALLNNDSLRQAIDNLEEVEALTLLRLRTELAHLGQDMVLEKAISTLQARRKAAPQRGEQSVPIMIPTRYRLNGVLLSFFSTIAQFGSTGDIAMSELKVEMLFPADDQTRIFLSPE